MNVRKVVENYTMFWHLTLKSLQAFPPFLHLVFRLWDHKAESNNVKTASSIHCKLHLSCSSSLKNEISISLQTNSERILACVVRKNTQWMLDAYPCLYGGMQQKVSMVQKRSSDLVLSFGLGPSWSCRYLDMMQLTSLGKYSPHAQKVSRQSAQKMFSYFRIVAVLSDKHARRSK